MNKNIFQITLIAFISLMIVSCNYNSNLSGAHWMMAMHDMHSIEAQEEDHTTLVDSKMQASATGMDQVESWGGPGSGIRALPQGAIPRGIQPYPYSAGDFTAAGNELNNPLPKTKNILVRGQNQFNAQCAVCHGYTADGNGNVSPRFVGIPPLNNPKIKNWKDGEIFHMITMGRGRMKSSAAQIDVNDRWAIIHYLRLLQNKASGSPNK